ncbi:MAG: Gfo/Idh/MocA family oxidoreductase [Deltaproteobacteria bacterium]|uniref:Gfo/Idh/MocA family oxidoreductase n=1 Tax=Candidatus Zymogenus saltonus TaxID=2844893 RepID=A0A9D8PR17_9DELT|nr:Gfo/Idh/MocA family oxidoreductase [Candidatus Zymogenus saltonus]
MAPDKIKVGIIGCGQVSRVGHGLAVKADGRAVVAAAADPDDENRGSFRKKFKVPAVFSDHRNMFKEADLDAVVIASPPWFHRQHLKDSIDAGLHILCEKPLATTPGDVRAMVDMARGHDKIVQVGHSKRFEPGFGRIKEEVDSGTLGRIYQLSIYWHYYIPDFRKGWLKKAIDFLKKRGIDLEKKYGTWRYFDKRAGGGDFFDHAPHYIDLMRFIFGEIESVYCVTRRFIETRAHEDLACAVLTLKNDTVAVFEKSTLVMGRPSGFEIGYIYGEKAKIFFEAFQEYTHKKMKLKSYKPVNIIPNIYTPMRVPGGLKNTLYFRQMRHFIDRIVGQKTVIPKYDGEWSASIEDAALAVLWTLAGYRSAEEGREIRREELDTL